MDFGFVDVIEIIGSLGLFIYGMKVMSDGIQKLAGNKMRQIMSAITNNRFSGVFTGLSITTLLQSSSATTVMVVSFVNAGLLTLIQSIGVIMGANIGTTVTAWLVSVFGFGKFSLVAFCIPLFGIAVPLLFSSKNRLKSLGEFLIGFGLLFIGLNYLKESVPDLKHNPEALNFLGEFAKPGYLSTMFFVAVGTILTVVVQSSSAAMTLTLALLHSQVITFDMAAAMVLGENIGTTITANLAALIANVHAKRAARAHLVFNIFGVVWMLLVFYPFVEGIHWGWDKITDSYGSANPDLIRSDNMKLKLSLFHTSFNIINMLLLVWFIPHIGKMVVKMVKSKGEIDEEHHLEYIGSMVSSPELALLEAKKETAKFGEITHRMVGFVKSLLTITDKKKFDEQIKRVKKYEDITDRIEEEISDYLAKVSTQELSTDGSIRVRTLLSISNDLERVGDILYQMSVSLERKNQTKTWFTPERRDNLLNFFKLIDQAMEVMRKNLETEYTKVSILPARELEDQINKMRDQLREEHLKSIEKGDFVVKSGMIYNDIFASMEKLGDHIINVTEAIVEVRENQS